MIDSNISIQEKTHSLLEEAASSAIQVATVSSGTFASIMQIKSYMTSGYNSVCALKEEITLSQLLALSESVTLFVTSFFFSQIGGLIHDVLSIRSGVVSLMQGNLEDAALKISFSVLSLTAQLTFSLHARVALMAFTVLLDLGHSYASFKEERYIEGLSSILCAAIRVRKNGDLFSRYHRLLTRGPLERRMAIDVGSGSTKVMIADVDIRTNRVKNVVYQTSIPTAYQKDLEASTDGRFSSDIQKTGLRTFEQINALAKEHGVDKVYGVATAAFRNSSNGEEFVKRIKDETGISVSIISQHEEGVLAYESVKHTPELDSKDYIAWDIGTGSFQITAPNGEKKFDVYMTETGSVPFKNFIIDEIKGENLNMVDTPNPLSPDAGKEADAYARWIGRHAQKSIKDYVKGQEGKVVGIGRLFQNSLLPFAKGETIKRKDLRDFIRSAYDKRDDELNNPFANVDVSNAILALAVMKALHIHEIFVVDSTSTKGILAHEDYWMSAN